MEKFSTFFGLKLAHLIFSASGQLSTTLQAKDTTAQNAFTAARLTQDFKTRQREHASFKTFYEAVVTEAKDKQNYLSCLVTDAHQNVLMTGHQHTNMNFQRACTDTNTLKFWNVSQARYLGISKRKILLLFPPWSLFY